MLYVIHVKTYEEGCLIEGEILVDEYRVLAFDERYQDGAEIVAQGLFFYMEKAEFQIQQVDDSVGHCAKWYYLDKKDRPQKHIERAKRRHDRKVATETRGRVIVQQKQQLTHFDNRYEEGKDSKLADYKWRAWIKYGYKESPENSRRQAMKWWNGMSGHDREVVVANNKVWRNIPPNRWTGRMIESAYQNL